MRILHIISSLDSRAGGPPMVISRLAAAQAGLGHEVHLLYYGVPETGGAPVEMDVSSLPHGKGVHCHRLPPPDKAEWFFAKAAMRELGSFLAQVDVLNLHGVWDPILRKAGALARRQGKPYVVAPHGMLDTWALSEKKWKKRVALTLGYRALVQHAALLHAISPYEAECLRAFGARPPIAIIPNAIFLEEIDPLPPRGAWVADRPQFAGKRWILFLSRLHPVKGLDLLGRAFAELAPRHPDLDLVVAGPDFGARAPFEALVKQCGIESRVHIVGPLWGRERFKPMVDAACFCLPSQHESFGLAICEAMACGAPVVFSEDCHILTSAEADALGVGKVVKREVRALVDAIESVLSDPVRAAEMGRRARALVEDRFTWPRVAAHAVEAYRQAGAS